MSEREGGFPAYFAKSVEAVLTSFHSGLIYAHEARENLRLAGMDLDEGQAEMPDFTMMAEQQGPDEEEFPDE
jgi:hypothetical protein